MSNYVIFVYFALEISQQLELEIVHLSIKYVIFLPLVAQSFQFITHIYFFLVVPFQIYLELEL